MDHTYFTWPDRRFRYDCRGCAACCKGHGIGLDVAGGQLVQLLARRPALAAFLRRRGEAITAFNPRDRCWFLTGDGLCRIEVEDGRAAKPASCRLFPFNRVFRLGPYTIVDYNSVICPLQVGDDGVGHAEVIAEIAGIADPTVIGTPLPARDAAAEGRAFVDTERAIAAAIFAAPGDLAAAWAAQADAAALDRERAVASAAFAAILGSGGGGGGGGGGDGGGGCGGAEGGGGGTFDTAGGDGGGRTRDTAGGNGANGAGTRDTAGGDGGGSAGAWDAAGGDGAGGGRTRDTAGGNGGGSDGGGGGGGGAAEGGGGGGEGGGGDGGGGGGGSGAAWQVPSPATLTAAGWLTPSLRFNELYGPRQYAPRSTMAPVLARMWLAWLGFAALGEQLAERPLGLQELTTLWSEQAPLMHAVARWTEAPALKPGPIELPGVDPQGLVRSLARSFIDNRKARRPLGELVAALPGDASARVTALKSADAILRAGFAGR